jgi:BlaI family penicillinase repressor
MAESSQPPALSEAQMEIMDVIWDRGEATVAEVWRVLTARRKVARNTVQTMIARLEEKRWLERRDDGQALRYRATRPRGATMKGLVRRLVDTAFRGSPEGLVMALLEGRRLSKAEAERIRAMIDQATRSKS